MTAALPVESNLWMLPLANLLLLPPFHFVLFMFQGLVAEYSDTILE